MNQIEIKLHEIPVRDVVAGYVDNQEDGVVGYGGKLAIRTPFQREFINNEKEKKLLLILLIKTSH